MDPRLVTDEQRLKYLLACEANLLNFVADGGLSASADDRPTYRTNYIGSKQKLVSWIWEHTSEDTNSVVDPFCGSGVVSYMFKSKGLAVSSNDRLHYSFHIARAIVENNDTTLDDDDIEALVAEASNADTYVQDNFAGLYFPDGVHQVIDHIRSNINSLDGYKKDIALFALGKSCISGKANFGHFSTSVRNKESGDTPEQFRNRFAAECRRINALVFHSDKSCAASHGDAVELLPDAQVDLAYFDPPYATQFSLTNYERNYHFIEGLMTYWDGLELDHDKKLKNFKSGHIGVTRKNANEFFNRFLSEAKHIPNWLISYRDKSFPNEAQIAEIVASNGKTCLLETKDHSYSISSKRGEASQAKEYLFICAPTRTNDDQPEQPADACRMASLPGDLLSTRAEAELICIHSEAQDQTGTGDKTVRFILTHSGTNQNGDHFTPEELESAAHTAIDKKIDLAHSQSFHDIVGGITTAEYIETDAKPRVECDGEIFTADSESARLAYKLMKRGIVANVSMECDYEEGECSVCSKRVRSRSEYCIHLKNYKGRQYRGKPVYEILHGVSFTGVGLLDREGADEGAVISKVAHKQGVQSMPDDTNPSTSSENQETQTPPAGTETPEAKIQRLRQENEDLNKKLQAAQKRIDELEGEKEAQARKTRAEKILSDWEKKGRTFDDADARAQELERLSALSEDAITATESVISSLPDPEEAPQDAADQTPATTASSSGGKPKADAGVKPYVVEDKSVSLEDRLKAGVMAAYEHRVSRETHQPQQ